jgi:curved DNA-binding protein CbpA
MAQDTDPYRTLGLTRDATLDEVRRAYRRLAKANHPDAAGEAALPRFLAIQAAYDTIAGPDARTRRPGAARAAGPRRPWDPDRDRAEATYRAYGGRPRRARPGGGPSPARGPSGQRPPGERPGTEGHAGPRTSRPARPPNKATLGSTSYDGAEDQPFEPDWGGASWYGTTSGTYWTLNPKEYADPRKHGPEYQARARRDLGGWEESEGLDPAGSPGAGGSALPDSESGTAATTGDPGPRRPDAPAAQDARPATHTTSSWWEATAGHAPRARGSASARSGPGSTAAATGPAGDAGTSAGTAAAARPRFDRSVPDRPARLTIDGVLEAVRAWLDDERPGAMGRIARAIVGWAPIALGIGWVSGEISGCGRFAAGCDDAAVMSAWLIQIAVLVVLLVVSRLARIASVATLATLAAAIPAALLLSATGSPDDAAAGRVALSGLLVIAWVVGLVFSTARELRGIGLGGRPVS